MAKPTAIARQRALNNRIRRLKHAIYRHEQERKGNLTKGATAFWASIGRMRNETL
jgi:hypothetical protein